MAPTAHVIDTQREIPLTILGGDTVVVRPNGRIVTSGDAIGSSGTSNRITVEGTVIGSGWGATAVKLASSVVNVAANGQVYGHLNGLLLLSSGRADNAGTIQSSVSAVCGSGQLTVLNTGLIEGGQFGIFFTGSGIGELSVRNAGTIKGGDTAVLGSPDNDAIINTGHLEGRQAVSLLAGNDLYNARDNNGGTATGLIDLGLGNDRAFGGAGSEMFHGGEGDDLIDGGAGNDTATYSGTANVTIDLGDPFAQDTGEGEDTLISIENLRSSGGNDLLTGSSADNILEGGGGNDSLSGEGGNDRLDGGAGADRMTGGFGNDVFIVDSTADAVIEARGGGYDTVYASSTSFTLAAGAEVELIRATAASSVTGSSSANKILANARANVLKGMAGNDALYGYAGNDKLWGGLGRDDLYGGAGRDVFVFDTAPGSANYDRVRDFRVVDDSIFLDNKVFRKLGSKGTEKSPARLKAEFFALDGHKDANDYVSYNVKTGVLTYDPDGSGAARAQVIAILNKGLKTFSHLDVFVI